MWHVQVTSLTLRHFGSGGNFEDHAPYDAVAQVEILSPGFAFIHATLRSDGKPLTRSDWRELGKLLHERLGIHSLVADRRGKQVVMTADRWLRNPT